MVCHALRSLLAKTATQKKDASPLLHTTSMVLTNMELLPESKTSCRKFSREDQSLAVFTPPKNLMITQEVSLKIKTDHTLTPTMLSQLWAGVSSMEENSGSLETPGVHHGEKKVSSELSEVLITSWWKPTVPGQLQSKTLSRKSTTSPVRLQTCQKQRLRTLLLISEKIKIKSLPKLVDARHQETIGRAKDLLLLINIHGM